MAENKSTKSFFIVINKEIISKQFKRRRTSYKSTRRMPWHQEPMKDVTSCDKPRGAANKHYIRGFPNGETPLMKNQGT